VQQQGGRTRVVVEGKGEVVVEVGLSDDNQVEIKSGLSAGARVLIPTAKRSATSGAGSTRGASVPGAAGMGRGLGGVGGGGGPPR
jgi:hypothetical protein